MGKNPDKRAVVSFLAHTEDRQMPYTFGADIIRPLGIEQIIYVMEGQADVQK